MIAEQESPKSYVIAANRTIAVLTFFLNLYYLPVTILNLISQGGPEGWGLLLLPFSISVNLLIATGALAFTQKFKKSIFLLLIQILGFVFASALLFLLLSTPNMD